MVTLQRWNEHGAMPIGARTGNGAVVRDPGGAMLALIDSAEVVDAGVSMHVLLTPNAAHAAQIYAELFGWALTETLELGSSGSRFGWSNISEWQPTTIGRPNAATASRIKKRKRRGAFI